MSSQSSILKIGQSGILVVKMKLDQLSMDHENRKFIIKIETNNDNNYIKTNKKTTNSIKLMTFK